MKIFEEGFHRLKTFPQLVLTQLCWSRNLPSIKRGVIFEENFGILHDLYISRIQKYETLMWIYFNVIDWKFVYPISETYDTPASNRVCCHKGQIAIDR